MPDQSSAATEHAILQEITAPLERLPDDPLALVDVEFATAMRGYDRHAVDEYVERTRRLVAELHATRSPEAAVRRALERVGDQVAGILQRAHETAEQITARSRSEGEDRLEDARREAARILDDAELRVRELDADTDRIWAERQRIVADADDLAVQLGALAREAGERFAESESAAPQAQQEPEPRDAFAGSGVDDDAPQDEPGIDKTVAFTALKLDGEAEAQGDESEDAEPEDDEPGDVEPEDQDEDEDERGSGEPDAESDQSEGAAELTGAWDPTNPALDVASDDADDPAEQSTRIIPPASDAARRHESQ